MKEQISKFYAVVAIQGSETKLSKYSRYHGSEDMDLEDKLRVKHILEKSGKFVKIVFNQFLLTPLDPEAAHEYIITNEVSETLVKDWKLKARPDIIALQNNYQPIFIEIDGKVHKGNLDTRPVYDELKIKYIILNKEYLEKSNISWEKYLTEQLAKLT